MKKILSKFSFRFLTQAAIISLVFYLALTHQRLGIEKAAPIDAYCPFGAVESFFTLTFKGEFLSRIFTSSFVLLGIFLLATLFLGRVFCGYFCPLGALQEWLRNIGRRLGLKGDYELPEKADRYLRYAKYLVLAVVVYCSFYLGDLVFRNYDPYNALMHFGVEFEEKVVGYSILAVVLLSAIFSKNWWCRYFCPLGAFFALVKKISFFGIKRDVDTCVSCGLCDQICPAGLKIKTADRLKEADCVSCGRCVKVCPKDSLNYDVFGKKLALGKFSWLVLVMVILPLAIAPYTPFWKTKPESNIINSKGEINTADIRGSNTLQYVLETSKVPLSEFQSKLNLPRETDLSLKLKELGLKYNLKNKDGEFLEAEDFRKVIDDYLMEKKNQPSADCPFDQEDCRFPGECGRYIDANKDGLCDHSK